MFTWHLYRSHNFTIWGKLSFNKNVHIILLIFAFPMPILI